MKKILSLAVFVLLSLLATSQNFTFSPTSGASGTQVTINMNSGCMFQFPDYVTVDFGTVDLNFNFTVLSTVTVALSSRGNQNTDGTVIVTVPSNITCNSKIRVTHYCSGRGQNEVLSSSGQFFNSFNFNNSTSGNSICSGSQLNIPLSTTNDLLSRIDYSWYTSNNTNLSGESTNIQNTSIINDALVNLTNSNQQLTYTISATQHLPISCIISQTQQVQIKPSTPIASVISSMKTSGCQGESIILSRNSNQGVWKNGNTILNSNSTFTATSSGQYYVSNSNGCGISNSNIIAITINPKPTLLSPNNIEICSGLNTNYNLSANELCNYTWTASSSNISGETSSGSGNSIIDILTNTTNSNQSINYQIKLISQSTGCTNNQNISVLVKPKPIVNTQNSFTKCSGDTVNLQLNGNIINETYSWYAVDNLNVTGEKLNPQTTNLINDKLVNHTTSVQSVNYNITPISECGNGIAQTISILIFPIPRPIITASGPLTFCTGGNVNLTSDNYSQYKWSNGNLTNSISVNQTGKFYVNVTNQDGCKGNSDTLSIIVNTIPNPLITKNGSTLKSNYTSGNQWYFNGVLIAGAVYDTYIPVSNGVYSNKVLKNACLGISNDIYIGDVGLIELQSSFLSIFPNPTNGTFKISSPTESINSIVVFDNLGKIVFSNYEIQKEKEHSIDLINCADGMYTVKVTSNSKSNTSKIFLQK